MAKEKKPSIYVDRGTIGSSDELDEYGVWVKSEPQDLSSAGIETGETHGNEDSDFSIPDMDDLPNFDSSMKENPKSSLLDNDFDLPVMDSELDLDSGEDDDRDVFNFGDLTETGSEIFSETAEDITIDDSLSEDTTGEVDLPAFTETSETIDFETVGFTEETESDDFSVSEDSVESEDDFTEIAMDDFIGPNQDDSPDMSVDSDDSEIFIEEETESPPAKISSGTHGTQDLSTQLLMKIAEELSSIRTELRSLKKEFAGIKVAASAAEGEEGNIYGGEDDEKISLTGDELNNILNTADFTEEAGSDATIDFSDDIVLSGADELPSESLDGSEIEDLDVEMDLGKTNLDIVSAGSHLGHSPDQDEDAGSPDFDSENIEELSEISAEPITFAPAPEDSDYLSSDPLATGADSDIEELMNLEELSDEVDDSLEELSDEADDSLEELTDEAEESIDLSEAVIDEPDLSSDIHDNPLEEPSLDDISISLDLSDLDSEEWDSVESDSGESEATVEELPELSELGDVEDSQISDDLSLDVPEELAEEASELESQALLEASDDEIPAMEEIEILDIDDSAAETLEDTSEILTESLELETLEEAAETLEVETLEEAAETLEILEEAETAKPVLIDSSAAADSSEIPSHLKRELKTVLSYMDQLLEALPDDKIEEFARSEYYDTYKKLFRDLGLV
ncbi:MAG: hypothetical protein LBH42_04555 [Treponema sp.]|jgi:hypothetical protein|nr:hypothetical protein [Treponema sp.]